MHFVENSNTDHGIHDGSLSKPSEVVPSLLSEVKAIDMWTEKARVRKGASGRTHESQPLTKDLRASWPVLVPQVYLIYTHDQIDDLTKPVDIRQHGVLSRCEVTEIHQIPFRVQSEGGHAKGQSGGYEEVCTAPRSA